MNVAQCHVCLLRSPPPYTGAMACTVDGRDVVAHAEASYCPHPDGPRFGDAKTPAGWELVPVAELSVRGTPLPEASPPADVLSPETRSMVNAEAARLGDELEVIAKSIGADKLAKAFEELTGWSCGCEARKRLLNKLPGIAAAFGWSIVAGTR